MKLTALIPAYNPTENLVEIVRSLVATDFSRIVVVNDGSEVRCDEIFRKIADSEKVVQLDHVANLGKGAAIKTGLSYLHPLLEGSGGVVVIDADGQHLVEDALKVAENLSLNSDSLIMGVREFDREVPLRSRVGNRLTSILFRLLTGTFLRDTQTGLRGIPLSLIPTLLKIRSNGYEFELDMLLSCKYAGVPILQQRIQTVYLDGNKTSHFNPFIDSMKIYYVLFRFSLTSLLSALIDNLVFIIVYDAGASLPISQVLARVLATGFNYTAVRKRVFLSRQQITKTLPKYLLLVIFSGIASYQLIKVLTFHFSISVIAAKIIAESLVFVLNFTIQRDFIFGKKPEKGGSQSLHYSLQTSLGGSASAGPVTYSDGEVFLVNPVITSVERYGRDVGDIGGHQMPLGIYYLAASLKREGERVKVLDAESLRLEHEEVVKILKTSQAAIVGLTSTTVSFRNARSLAEMIRQELPHVIIVIGGPHMTAMTEATMKCGAFDYGIVKEGERSFAQLVKLLLRGEGCLAEIPNLYYLKGGEVIGTTAKQELSDLDTLPFPARELCPDISLYRPPVGAYRHLPVVSIITSRGCPFECIFCDNNTFGRTTRFHSAEYVVAEIREVVSRYQAKEIAFLDDTFVLDKPRLYRIFNLLREEDIHISWTCMTRVNNLDEELLRFMRDCGCWQIRIGIESGNQEVLDFIKKGITLEQVRNVAHWCKKLGIRVSGFFIIGHHIDTPQSIQDTIDFASSLPLTDVIATINTPIPGTESYALAKAYGHYDENDWTSLNYWTPVFVPRDLTREFLLAKQAELYRRFYSRPSVLLRQVGKIRSLRILARLIKNAMAGVRFTSGRT